MYAGRESVAEVAAMVDDLFRIRESALYRALAPDDAIWGVTEHLLANAVDALAIANWMQTEDGAKGRKQPKPIQRPGVEPEGKTYGSSGGLPLAEMDEWLGWSSN